MNTFNILSMLVLAIAAMDFSIPVAIAAADRQAPTVPTGLTAQAISAGQIELSWNKSTDNVGVTGYKIYLKSGSTFTQISTSSTNSYSHTWLTASTGYTYQLAAYDAANNVSKPSVPPTSNLYL